MSISCEKSEDRTCSFCGKPAIGYETVSDGGWMVCEDHASEKLLSMKPGEKYDERGDMLSWEFLVKTKKLVPEYHYRFGGISEPEEKIVEGFWTLDDCANVLMVHREDVWKLIRKGYLKSKEEEGITYIEYLSIHEYIECMVKWRIFLPVFWKIRKMCNIIG
jgi:hypothetical protein